ncbi:MAG: hypothetical protein IJQ87_00765 [Clostridia bacterium]|nr:hypothetical protein [Clostridia bacterium]
MANNSGGKPSASKTTKRVKANNIFASTGQSGAKKRSPATTAKRAVSVIAAAGAVKAAKKANGKTLLAAFICFILALAVGAGVCFFLGRNDRFELIGEEHVYLEVNERYSDDGVDIREFGLDFSKKAVIETDLEHDSDGNYYAASAGDYYIAYTIKSLKFGLIYPVQKIRLISVIGASEGGE